MPVNMVRPNATYGWAKETTKGTGVAQTSLIVCEGVECDPQDTIVRPELAVGVAYQNRGHEFVTVRGTKWSVPAFPLNAEQAHIWGLMAVKGGVAASGANPYTWTLTPSLTADPALQSRSFERRMSDGANNIDDKWLYAMCQEFGIRWAERGFVEAYASGFARARQDATITPATPPTALNQFPAALVTVFIDDAWAGIGGTQVSAQVLDGEWKINTGYEFYAASDGRTDYDFSSYQFNPSARTYSLKLTLLVQNSGQTSTERTKAAAAALRAVRVRVSISASLRLTIDGLYKHEMGTSLVRVGERNGQDIVELNLLQSTDGTNGMSYVVINGTNTDA